MYDFRHLAAPLITFAILGVIFIPFGIWKVIELIIWIFNNVKVVVS